MFTIHWQQHPHGQPIMYACKIAPKIKGWKAQDGIWEISLVLCKA
jgi:hypothetical protein